ncbi:MAG: hypothetical protein MK102_17310 [Fuerstiella sp.]|nr:hypothetical protein [Fuerstiella sp.]
MRVTAKPSNDSPQQSVQEILPKTNLSNDSDITTLSTTVDPASGSSSPVRQVGGWVNDTSLEFGDAEETPDASFDDPDFLEFRTSDKAEKTDFAISGDDGYEEQNPVQSEFDTNTDLPNFDEISRQQGQSFDRSHSAESTTFQHAEDSTSVSASSEVPESNIDSLPSKHTGPQQPTVEVDWKFNGTLNIGQESQCSLIVTNTGSSLVRNVTVEAAIPGGIDVLSAVPVPHANTSRWSVGDLESGASRSIEIVLVPRQRGDIAFNAFVRFTGYSTSVLTVQEPMLRMAVQGPDSVNVGDQAGYKVRVENPGSGIAHNVVIEAHVPDGMQHRSGSVPRIHVGTLNPGDSRQAMLNLTGLDGGTYRLAVRALADGDLSDEARKDIRVARPSLAISMAGPKTADVGSPVDYEVIVKNILFPGSGTAHNVVIEALVPDGMQHRSGSVPKIHIGTLKPGDSRRALLNLKALDGGTYRLAVRAVADGDLSDETRTDIRITRPSLAISMTGPKTADIGSPVDYEVVVKNTGDVPSTNVRAKYRIPNDARFLRTNRGGVHQSEEKLIDWFVGTIQPGESSRYLITLEPGSPGTAVHRAGVKSENTGITMVSHTTMVRGVAELQVNIEMADAVPAAGQETDVRIVVRNEGSADAENVGVICELPSGLQFVAADGPADCLSQNGVLIFRSIDAVEAKAEVNYLIKAKCVRPGSHRVRVRVGSESLPDPVIGEGTVNARAPQ